MVKNIKYIFPALLLANVLLGKNYLIKTAHKTRTAGNVRTKQPGYGKDHSKIYIQKSYLV